MATVILGPQGIEGEMAALVEALQLAGWDAKVRVIRRDNGEVLIGLSAWLSILPDGSAWPTPTLLGPHGEVLAALAGAASPAPAEPVADEGPCACDECREARNAVI